MRGPSLRFVSALVVCATLFLVSASLRAVSPNIVISQLYGGGGNSGATYTHDYIELFNRGTTTVSLTGWSVQYASATGTGLFSSNVTTLSGSLAPGQYFLIREAAGAGGTTALPTPDATGSIAMSATAGKVVVVNSTSGLACNGGSTPCSSSQLAMIVDLVGYGGANFFEGAAPAPILSNTTSDFRGSNGCTDTDNNSADFAAGTAYPNARNTSTSLNVCSGPGVPTNPTGVGAANPNIVEPADMTLLTVTVTPGANPTSTGITVTGNLDSIGGSMTQMFFDNATNGDVTAGDNVFSYQATVLFSTTPGNKTIPVTVADAQARSSLTSIALAVVAADLAIHDIQGSGSSSPNVGQFVGTSGIVTARRFNNGFFLQEPNASMDADPSTSEGIFVFTGSAPAVAVGDAVLVAGTVLEFIPSQDPNSPPLTEIGGSPVLSVLSTGNSLPTPVTLTAADTSPGGSIEQLEKFEGMRVLVNSLTVVAPTMGSTSEPNATSTSNGVFYGVITDTIGRPFRETGIETPNPFPPGSPCCIPIFDANPERLRVDSDGQVGGMALEVTTGATVTGLVGPLDYAFRTYSILPDPGSSPGVSGNISAIPVRVRAADEFTVAGFNVERFFDTVNDPAIGEPVLTPTAFNNRLNKVSLAIRNLLRSPDILGMVEVENLTTLQAIATKLNTDDPSLNYVAYLEEGNDIGGIDVGFLVNDNRADVVDVTQEGKTATFVDPTDSSVDILNDRPPLVLRANITPPAGAPFSVTVIVNHLRSLNGVDEDPGDGPRVREKRRKQAEFLADLIQNRQIANPNERIISVGDYNAFQFNDGYVDSMGTIKGMPTPASQVVLASNDLVNPDLSNLIDMLPPTERYSFIFDGNSQFLDHILATQNLLGRVEDLEVARVGADFPETFRNDPNMPERITDHDALVAYFQLPAISALSPAKIWVGLANSDDVGIRFDLRAEVYRNGSELIGSGEVPSAIGGSSGFNNAKLNSIPLSLTNVTGVAAGDMLSIKLLVRNACSGSGKNSGRARLWYNDAAANSRFDTTIDGMTNDWFLRDAFALAMTPGPGPKKTIDVQAGAKCSAYKPFGTWTATLN